MPKDGAALKLMLDNLDEQEQAMMQMFAGTTDRIEKSFTIRIKPEADMKEKVAFRFSKKLGMLDADNLSGEPYYISIINQETLPPMDPKADVRLLDGIRVDSYGSMVPINNVAAVNTPDARSIAIKPWDKSMFRVIEKAIIDSSLGIMPENNGEIIRIGIPPLTEERRRQLAKQCKGLGGTNREDGGWMGLYL